VITRGKGRQEEVRQGQASCCHSDHDHQPRDDQGQPTANDGPYNYSINTIQQWDFNCTENLFSYSYIMGHNKVIIIITMFVY